MCPGGQIVQTCQVQTALDLTGGGIQKAKCYNGLVLKGKKATRQQQSN